ncbi:hypothetical protein [Actinomadura sp. J1-007]|uniref:hypothetical protein n=1 Tax=Actinomadura sp. J1-007 TaxID=2661913 RepID=UPI001F4F4E3D|nr:hypothetical protein [Actinomadura sp. J1-007]
MRVVIAGGHGRIARKLERVLAGRGDRAEGLVRDRAGIPDLESAGARGWCATWSAPRWTRSRAC